MPPALPLHSLQLLVNRVLVLDDEAHAALSGLAGKTLLVELTDTRWRCGVALTATGVELFDEPPAEPDVTIRGTPAAFFGLVRGSAGTPARRIDISGDVTVAQEVQTILRNLDPDWEEPLSGWVGDTLARKTGNLIRETRRFLSQTGRTLEADISEYLRYEKEVLPDRIEIEEFNAAVDILRNDAERLKIRIARLQQALSGER